MDLRIFFSTFVLIFLAELGDKTQLAAMARAASSGSAKWTIFFAAASALVISTLVAVLFGSAITRVVPERYIRMGAGVLFVIFGVLILREALTARTEKPAAAAEPTALTQLVLRQAAAFERAAFEDYRALAARAQDPALRALLNGLAQEEETHFRSLFETDAAHPGMTIPEAPAGAVPAREALEADVAQADRPILDHAAEHEEATASFYGELARVSVIPSLARAFEALAASERDHASRLRQFARSAQTV